MDSMDSMDVIQSLIKRTMDNHDLSQGEMAGAIGVSRQTINAWARGRALPKYETVLRIRGNNEPWVRLFGADLTRLLLDI
jgi:DNA-binding XRE family transcriptional regulator